MALLDIPEIIGFSLSSITASGWKAKVVVFLLRTFFAIGLLNIAVAIVSGSSNRIFYGTDLQAWLRSNYFLGASTVTVHRMAIVNELPVIQSWTVKTENPLGS